MALSKESWDALPDSDFAVPASRQLPIHDKIHIKMAWSCVDRTKGLSDAERAEAKTRIIARAKELGMDTSTWEGVRAADDSQTDTGTAPSSAPYTAKTLNHDKTKKHALEALAAVLALMSLNFWKAYVLWIAPDEGYVPDDSATAAYGAERAETLLGYLDDTTTNAVDAALAVGREAGDTLDQLVQRVRGVMAPMAEGRARGVATTESSRAAGWASTQAANQAGVAEKQWLTMRDAKVRDTHAAMDGQVVAASDNFTSPSGAMAQHPGGFGVPEEDINCRCVSVPMMSEVEAAKATADTDWAHFEALRQQEEETMVPVIQGIFKAQTDAIVEAMLPSSITLQAMSLDMPSTPGHPNKMPFSGVLTFLDRPSDNAPCGSGGKKVILTRAAAEAALPTLLGMAIDHTSGLDGHDVRAKIGVIDEANIVGNQIDIKGFLYAADFPEECAQIKKDFSKLGFSWELKDINVADLNANPWVIDSCVFTGAALLQKQKADYMTTSLAAAADGAKIGTLTMNEIETLMAALAALTEKVDALQASNDAKDKAAPKDDNDADDKDAVDAGVQANAAEIAAKVKTHTDGLRNLADNLEAAGIGCHASRGHVLALRKMAASMDAEAAKGVVPSEHSGDSWYASADVNTLVASAVKSALAEVAPKAPAVVSPDLAVLKDELSSATTMIKDLQAAQTKNAEVPARKTVSLATTALLAKGQISGVPEGDEKMDLVTLDGALAKSSLTTGQRIEVKTALRNAGKLN